MKIIAGVVEDVKPDDEFVIVKFKGDKNAQHFQVFIDASPYMNSIRKGSCLLIVLKFRSVVMKDYWGNKTYETQFYSNGIPLRLSTDAFFDKKVKPHNLTAGRLSI